MGPFFLVAAAKEFDRAPVIVGGVLLAVVLIVVLVCGGLPIVSVWLLGAGGPVIVADCNLRWLAGGWISSRGRGGRHLPTVEVASVVGWCWLSPRSVECSVAFLDLWWSRSGGAWWKFWLLGWPYGPFPSRWMVLRGAEGYQRGRGSAVILASGRGPDQPP